MILVVAVLIILTLQSHSMLCLESVFTLVAAVKFTNIAMLLITDEDSEGNGC